MNIRRDSWQLHIRATFLRAKVKPRVDYFQVNTFITAFTIRKNNVLLQATYLYQSTWLPRHHDRGKLRTISFYADEGRNKFKRIGRIRKP